METPAFVQNILAELKRLPWWAWIIIAVGVYVGYRIITSGGSNSSSSDGGVSDSGGPVAVGNPVFPDPTPPPGGDLPPPFPDWPTGDPGAPPDAVTDNGGIPKAPTSVRDPGNNGGMQKAPTAIHDPITTPPDNGGIRKAPGVIDNTGRAAPPPAPRPAPISRLPDSVRRRRQDIGIGAGPDSVRYHTHPGETLSEVATRFGIDSQDLYDANRETIEAAAREHGLTDSGGGWYVAGVPGGVTLKIPTQGAA